MQHPVLPIMENRWISPGDPGRAGNRAAFSLMEMLIVIAIIAILAALLTPALGRAREQARLVICQSNLGQIAQATILYAADHNGYLPAPNWGQPKAGWLYTDGKMDRREDLQTGLLWPYIKNYSVYRCPSDYQPDENDSYAVPERPLNSRMITSYCMNGSVIRYGLKKNQAGNDWQPYPLSDFKQDDVLFWEPWESKAGGWWWDASNFPWEGLSYRHFGRGVVSCADGHTEAMEAEAYYAMSAKKPEDRVPPGKTGSGMCPTPSMVINETDDLGTSSGISWAGGGRMVDSPESPWWRGRTFSSCRADPDRGRCGPGAAPGPAQ